MSKINNKVGVDSNFVDRAWVKILSLENRFNSEGENDGKISSINAENALKELKKAKLDWKNRVTKEQFIKRWENILRDEKEWGNLSK
ncbi:MAG: hypothetical protein WCO84_02435 [bacterium]